MFKGTKAKDGAGDWHKAWEALNEKCSGHTKEARRACHEKLVNTKMESGQNPDDLFFVLDVCRDLLEKMGQTVHYKRYVDIIWRLSLQSTRGCETQTMRSGTLDWWTFGTHMVYAIFVDSLSRPFHYKPVADRGITMLAARHTNSDVRCSYCRGVRHLLPDSTVLKAREQRHGPNW